MFGILAVLARIEALRKTRQTVRQDLDVLAYLVEAARASRKSQYGLFGSRLEKIHSKIAGEICETDATFHAAHLRAAPSAGIGRSTVRQKSLTET
jgi:hypothetical protein